MTSAEIAQALRRRHAEDRWAFFDEVRCATGFSGRDAEQRIDAWAMHLWPSQRFATIAYEIKVSRGDFLRELKKPYKRLAAMRRSHLFYFAAPQGLIKPAELPEACGLVEVMDGGNSRASVIAQKRDVEPELDVAFWASIMRRVAKIEDGHLNFERTKRDLAGARYSLDRERARGEGLKREIASLREAVEPNDMLLHGHWIVPLSSTYLIGLRERSSRWWKENQ